MIRQAMRQGGHDIVVLTGLTNPHGAVAAHREGLPLVWQILDTATPAPVRAALMPLVRRWADAVMFNGIALQELHSRGRPLAQPTSIFTGPVDTARFHPATVAERTEMRAELGIPADAPVVGTVANLNPIKGIEWFIRAASRIYAARPDTWFVISGAEYQTHAAYRAELQRQMRESPVPADRWIVNHLVPDRCYPALDVKLITSVPASEGRTTTGPEAMACGVPVVATDVGAVREVIEHGRTGLVVPPLDADALATATLALLADPDFRARLGAEGRRRTVQLYGLKPSLGVHLEAFAAARRYHARRSSLT
jgi:glycosyltransferase involved in cell wall biosynthesis